MLDATRITASGEIQHGGSRRSEFPLKRTEWYKNVKLKLCMQIKARVSRRQTRATRCITANVLQT